MSSTRSPSGLPPGVHPAPTGPRLLAGLVEVGPVWVLIALSTLLMALTSLGLAVPVLCLGLAVVWAVLVWSERVRRAAGPGMRATKLQIVGLSDGRPLSWKRVVVRWLAFACLTVTVVGLIAMVVVMLRQSRRQSWPDLAANAVMIKERPLAPPRSKPAVARTQTSTPHPRRARQPDAPASVPAPAPATAPSALGATKEGPDAGESVEGVVDPPAGGDHRRDLDWWLTLDDGRDVGVDGLVLLGRNPQPGAGEEDATLIKVVDETRTVSKSHLAVGVDARGLYVMDRGSTNGSTVTSSDGTQRPCRPGDLVDVGDGSVVSFGDHWLEIHRRRVG
ncbi:MAG: RDD family protein [Microlunatus sp.]|nr:RDD family protein [Microlunatus sp.]